MSLRVGDNVFVNSVHPAKIVAFVDHDCCQVAWASGAKHGTVVSCSNVQSMFAEPTRRRRPTQTYLEETSTEAKKKMEAKKKPKERVAAVKKERTSLKETPNEPPKKLKRTKEPLSRAEAAAQVAAAFRSSNKKQKNLTATRKKTPAASAERSAAEPRRNVTTRLLAESDQDKKPAAEPRKNFMTRTRLPAVPDDDNKPAAKSMDVSSDYDSSSDTDHLLSISRDNRHDYALEIKPEVEDIAQPSSFRYEIDDNVWVKDGSTDYPAKVIGDMEDWLEIQYSNGLKDIVLKSAVTMMIDLTVDVDGPRRSKRRRCEPTIKNESKKDEKLGPRNKKSKAAAQRAKSAREPRKCKTKAAGSTSNVATSTHNLPNGKSDAASEGTDATFEYTAPHVDPKYRSRHVITSMERFMSVEPWKQPPLGSCDKQNDGDKEPPPSPSTTAKANVARAAIQTEGTPKVSQAMCGPPVLSAERLGLDLARLLHDTPSNSESICHVMRGPTQAASLSSPYSPTEAKALLDESTETANPDEIPEIILAYSDSEMQHDERRTTADPAEMSEMFAFV